MSNLSKPAPLWIAYFSALFVVASAAGMLMMWHDQHWTYAVGNGLWCGLFGSALGVFPAFLWNIGIAQNE